MRYADVLRKKIETAREQVRDADMRLGEARRDFEKALDRLLIRERIRGELGRKLDMLCEEAHLP